MGVPLDLNGPLNTSEKGWGRTVGGGGTLKELEWRMVTGKETGGNRGTIKTYTVCIRRVVTESRTRRKVDLSRREFIVVLNERVERTVNRVLKEETQGLSTEF